jgi:hypothetical protein
MKNDRARSRLLDEIDRAVQAGHISSDTKEVITDAQARQMPYLQGVIKEVCLLCNNKVNIFDRSSQGLRWLPPTGGLLAKQVPPGGDTIEGYWVPGGTIVGYVSSFLCETSKARPD